MEFTIALVCLLVTFVTTVIYLTRKDEVNEKIYSTMTTPELIKFLQSMHCELVKKINDDSFVIGFQGGYFHILRDKTGRNVQMFYKDFYACSYEQSKKVIFDVNSVNKRYMAWTCYLFKKYEDGKTEKPFTVSLSAYLFLSGEEFQLMQQFRTLLEAAFIIVNKFRELVNKPGETQNALEKKDFDNRLAILRRKLELGEGQLKESPEEYQEKMNRIEGVLSLFENIDSQDIKNMTLISGSRTEKRTELLSILSFDLKDAVTDEDGESKEEALIYIEFSSGHLVIVLEKAPGSNHRSLYYKLSAMQTEGADAFFDETQDGDMVSSLIEFRLTTENEDYWELKYMIDDAQDKVENSQFDELTEEQQALLLYAQPTLQSLAYWGKKYFCRECYIQSLNCYLGIFRYYQNHWTEFADQGKDDYYFTCYYIGFIYLTFGQYEKAYYYLNNARKGASLNAIRDFTNCLVEMKDAEAIEYIYTMVSLVNSQIRRYGDEKNTLIPLYNFLRRRAVQVLVCLKYFSQAKELLYQMLEEEDNKEFAQQELKHLEGMEVDDEGKGIEDRGNEAGMDNLF